TILVVNVAVALCLTPNDGGQDFLDLRDSSGPMLALFGLNAAAWVTVEVYSARRLEGRLRWLPRVLAVACFWFVSVPDMFAIARIHSAIAGIDEGSLGPLAGFLAATLIVVVTIAFQVYVRDLFMLAVAGGTATVLLT